MKEVKSIFLYKKCGLYAFRDAVNDILGKKLNFLEDTDCLEKKQSARRWNEESC